MELVRKVIEYDTLIAQVKSLKDIYTQLDINKALEPTGDVASQQQPLLKLISEKKLGNMKIDLKANTLIFEDDEIQQSMSFDSSLQKQNETKKLIELIEKIESQNVNLVDLMTVVKDTTDQIKTSENYAKFIVKSKMKQDGKFFRTRMANNFVFRQPRYDGH